MFKKIYFCFLILVTFLNCNKVKHENNDTILKDVETEIEIANSLVSDSIIIPNAFEKELVFDFDGDDQLDSLFLGADVAVDDNGNPMWDDAQNWFINLKFRDSLKTVYSKSIQLGKVNVYFDEIKNDIYLIEDAPFQKGIYKLDKRNNFTPMAIKVIPDTTKMTLVSID